MAEIKYEIIEELEVYQNQQKVGLKSSTLSVGMKEKQNMTSETGRQGTRKWEKESL